MVGDYKIKRITRYFCTKIVQRTSDTNNVIQKRSKSRSAQTLDIRVREVFYASEIGQPINCIRMIVPLHLMLTSEKCIYETEPSRRKYDLGDWLN